MADQNQGVMSDSEHNKDDQQTGCRRRMVDGPLLCSSSTKYGVTEYYNTFSVSTYGTHTYTCFIALLGDV